MAKSSPQISLLFLCLLIVTPAPPSEAAVSYFQLRSLFSLSHSLSTRVANLRDSRGDLAGAHRARLIADKLESGLEFRFWPTFWSMGWNFLQNYAWRDTTSLRDSTSEITAELNELLSSLYELTPMGSDSERAAWVAGNNGKVVRVFKSMFNRLLSVFSKSGAMREIVETLKSEMVDGAFLKDCFEVGANDFKALVQILKNLAFYGTSDHQEL